MVSLLRLIRNSIQILKEIKFSHFQMELIHSIAVTSMTIERSVTTWGLLCVSCKDREQKNRFVQYKNKKIRHTKLLNAH